MTEGTTQANFRVPTELWRQMKAAALALNTTVEKLAEEALREKIEKITGDKN